MSRNPVAVVATPTKDAGPAAAGLAVAASADQTAVLVRGPGTEPPRATLLCSEGAVVLERRAREAGLLAAARGRFCLVQLSSERDLRPLGGALADARLILDLGNDWRSLHSEASLSALVVRGDPARDRSRLALCAIEATDHGVRPLVAKRDLGPLAARRARAGLEPGGRAGAGLRRVWDRILTGEGGQALPFLLGCALCLVVLALGLAAIGGAVTGKGRLQRAADLAAISAARSLRDDHPRLFGSGGLAMPAYRENARRAAREAARRNGVPTRAVEIGFPGGSVGPAVRVRVAITGVIGHDPDTAEATSVAIAEAAAPAGAGGQPPVATGGGYSGPLEYRQGKPMRPDVAAAFDRMALAASSAGIHVLITSGFRSDEEQARLFAANPDPTWVAPPGKSLHRCGTELDLGPSVAYGWLAANAPRFGFVKRYSWEPWHFGYTQGPAPCGSAPVRSEPAGERPATALPAYVPAAYRGAISAAASRQGVSAALLAAQLRAESNFDPRAVSPAGAQGIAQFMPATANAYGLSNPFDPVAAIDAQARLMAELLGQFGSAALALAAYNAGPGAVSSCGCVPPYAETQAYVARILAELDGAGELFAPPLEVRLIR